MVVIIYSAETDESITANLGRPEYSYYFVSKAYRDVLRQFACVVETSDPENEVDAIYEKCRALGEPCVFLSFSPPQRIVTGLRCPTIGVFAWEFATIPTVPFAAEPRNDWRTVFRRHGCAITHSRFAVRAVQQAMGGDFPGGAAADLEDMGAGAVGPGDEAGEGAVGGGARHQGAAGEHQVEPHRARVGEA